MSTCSDSICENTFETSHVRFIHANFSVLITTPLDQIQQNLLRKEICQTTAKPADIVLQTWFEEYPTPPSAPQMSRGTPQLLRQIRQQQQINTEAEATAGMGTVARMTRVRATVKTAFAEPPSTTPPPQLAAPPLQGPTAELAHYKWSNTSCAGSCQQQWFMCARGSTPCIMLWGITMQKIDARCFCRLLRRWDVLSSQFEWFSTSCFEVHDGLSNLKQCKQICRAPRCAI